MTLCDIVLQREMPFLEVRRLRQPLALLREVFGDARMEPLAHYAAMAEANGLVVDLDEQGEVVGFDIDFASKRFDLSTLETVALPLRTTTAA